MKFYVFFVVFLVVCSCKIDKEKNGLVLKKAKIKIDTITNVSSYKQKKQLKSINNFTKFLKNIKNVKYSVNKHSDARTNNTFLLDSLLQLKESDFKIETKSYEYKKKCIFYNHTIKYLKDSLLRKKIIENIQEKQTMGYLGERILIFAMKNDKEANYIDIPANWNHIELKEELLDLLYRKINSDIIVCYRTKPCEYKDLRKN